MTPQLRIIPLILLAVLASGCSKGEEQSPAAKRNLQFPEELPGEALFNERCRDCHMVQEKGGAVGPDLSQVGSKRDPAFLEQVIREPSRLYPGTVMPPYDTFSTKQVNSLVDYLSALKKAEPSR